MLTLETEKPKLGLICISRESVNGKWVVESGPVSINYLLFNDYSIMDTLSAIMR